MLALGLLLKERRADMVLPQVALTAEGKLDCAPK